MISYTLWRETMEKNKEKNSNNLISRLKTKANADKE